MLPLMGAEKSDDKIHHALNSQLIASRPVSRKRLLESYRSKILW